MGQGRRVNDDDIDHLIELSEVYDGWSIAVIRDGTLVNRWARPEAPYRGLPGYERRFQQTQLVIEQIMMDRQRTSRPT